MDTEKELSISKELEKMEYIPLLPVEKKLIVISLLLGFFLLAFVLLLSKLTSV